MPPSHYQPRHHTQTPSSFSARFSRSPYDAAPAAPWQQQHPAALLSGSVASQHPQPYRGSGSGSGAGAGGFPAYLSEDRVRSQPGVPRRSRQASAEDGVTLGPYDSVSNADRDDWAGRDTYGQQYQQHPPPQQQERRSARFSRLAYTNSKARPRSVSNEVNNDAYFGYDARESVGNLPLMQYSAGYAQHEKGGDGEMDDSVIDGDTEAGLWDHKGYRKSSHDHGTLPLGDGEQGIASSYPPASYESQQEEKQITEARDQNGAALRRAQRKKNRERPNVWMRQIRDTTAVEEKMRLHKKGIGVQDRPWACYVLVLICCIIFIVELVKSVSAVSNLC